MGTYLEQANLSLDENFIKRVEIAALKTAVVVQQEASSVVGHSARLQLAQSVANNPIGYSRSMSPGVCADTSISAASIDTVIYDRVFVIWNTYCGVGQP